MAKKSLPLPNSVGTSAGLIYAFKFIAASPNIILIEFFYIEHQSLSDVDSFLVHLMQSRCCAKMLKPLTRGVDLALLHVYCSVFTTRSISDSRFFHAQS